MKKNKILFSVIICILTVCMIFPTYAGDTQASNSIKYVGVQRTVNADGNYGIRFIATVDSTSYDSIGFDVVSMEKDGTNRKTFNQEGTTVYNSIKGTVDGVETTIEAEMLGGKYIYTFVIKNIPTTIEIAYFEVTPYVTSGSEKQTADSHVVVYDKGVYRERTELSDGTTLNQIKTTFVDGTGSAKCYQIFDGLTDKGASISEVADNFYVSASLEVPAKVSVIRLTKHPSGMETYNKGLSVQLSADNENWDTALKITEFQANCLKKNGSLEIKIPAEYQNNEYKYIRIYQEKGVWSDGSCRYAVGELETFAADEISIRHTTTLNKINTTFLASTMTGKTYQIFDGDVMKGSSAWDTAIESLYVSASFNVPTKVALIRMSQHPGTSVDGGYNTGLSIQLSSDNENWDTVIKLTEVEVAYLQNSGRFEINVPTEYADNEYSYIRIYQEKGVHDDGSCRYAVGEIEVFTSVEISN